MEISYPTFSISVIKLVRQKQLEGERDYVGSEFQGPGQPGGKSRHEDPEAAGHIVSTIKTKEINVGTQLTLIFIQPRSPV